MLTNTGPVLEFERDMVDHCPFHSLVTAAVVLEAVVLEAVVLEAVVLEAV